MSRRRHALPQYRRALGVRPFRYRLQVALDRAVDRERDAASALARATAAVDSAQAALDELDAQAATLRAQILTPDARAARSLREIDISLNDVATLRVRRAERVAEARSAQARARADLADRAQQRSALEHHRDRCRVEYDALVEARENAELDEANIFARHRKGS